MRRGLTEPEPELARRGGRFDAPRRTCPHCGLVAQTRDPRCPVCAARYFPTWRQRWRAWRRGA